MKRQILQIPISAELRKIAEMSASEMGFSSLQEMVRVMLKQISLQQKSFDIENICNRYGINYLGLFGSVARGEARSDSDIDLLVRFDDQSDVGLYKLARIQDEFEKKIGRKVDLVTKMNKYVLPEAMKDLKTIYEK